MWCFWNVVVIEGFQQCWQYQVEEQLVLVVFIGKECKYQQVEGWCQKIVYFVCVYIDQIYSGVVEFVGIEFGQYGDCNGDFIVEVEIDDGMVYGYDCQVWGQCVDVGFQCEQQQVQVQYDVLVIMVCYEIGDDVVDGGVGEGDCIEQVDVGCCQVLLLFEQWVDQVDGVLFEGVEQVVDQDQEDDGVM